MNTAGALAVSRLGEGGPEAFPDQLRSSLQGTAGRLQALFGGNLLETLDIYRLTEQLSSPFFSNLVIPATLQGMRDTGTAGLLWFSREELDRFLEDVPYGEGQPVGSWLEVAPAGNGIGWIGYPQDSRPAARFVTYLPVIVGPEETRLVALDLGLDPVDGTTDRPSVVSGSGCEVGWRGHGEDLRQACLPGTCAEPCGEVWKMDLGELILVACNC